MTLRSDSGWNKHNITANCASKGWTRGLADGRGWMCGHTPRPPSGAALMPALFVFVCLAYDGSDACRSPCGSSGSSLRSPDSSWRTWWIMIRSSSQDVQMGRKAVPVSPGSISVCLPAALSAISPTVSQNTKYSKDMKNMHCIIIMVILDWVYTHTEKTIFI